MTTKVEKDKEIQIIQEKILELISSFSEMGLHPCPISMLLIEFGVRIAIHEAPNEEMAEMTIKKSIEHGREINKN